MLLHGTDPIIELLPDESNHCNSSSHQCDKCRVHLLEQHLLTSDCSFQLTFAFIFAISTQKVQNRIGYRRVFLIGVIVVGVILWRRRSRSQPVSESDDSSFTGTKMTPCINMSNLQFADAPSSPPTSQLASSEVPTPGSRSPLYPRVNNYAFGDRDEPPPDYPATEIQSKVEVRRRKQPV
ncbi:hypothetical protein DFH08DRAFT_992982 [Mycena albidolilacea]|uniref:Uncharacterized protein n=1 Tax=Mycena albidolilacea TaxID=1033008 RepID=A0AAD7EUA5_9AGAR|nr:hypothetical protein DFH08DRAFT_992982 [Mycena albidolilacea]